MDYSANAISEEQRGEGYANTQIHRHRSVISVSNTSVYDYILRFVREVHYLAIYTPSKEDGEAKGIIEITLSEYD